MVRLAGGRFIMGRADDPSERPAHKVTLRPFALSREPVTVGEWRRCVAAGACPEVPGSGVEDYLTMRNVSWNDAKAFVAWLARATGKAYRLPSEAEFDYAARAGTTSRWWWGDRLEDAIADCKGCGGPYDPRSPQEPPQFPPNPFGLLAMAGGIDEWVEDCWHKDYRNAPADGSAWTESGCASHVLRGGSWKSEPKAIRSSSRDFYDAPVRYPTHGFRVALSQE